MKYLWQRNAQDFFDNCLSEARRSEGYADIVRYEIYENVLIPAGDIVEIQPITFQQFNDQPWNYGFSIEATQEKVARAESCYPAKNHCYDLKCTRYPLSIALVLIEENGTSKVQSLELRSNHIGRQLPYEPALAHKRVQQLLQLCKRRDFNALAESISSQRIPPRQLDALMNGLTDLAANASSYELESWQYLGGEYWYNSSERHFTCHYKLSDDKSEFLFSLSFNEAYEIVRLDFDNE